MSPRLKPDERRTAELTARLGLGEEHGRTYAWLYGDYVHMRGLFNEFIEGFGPGMGLEPAHPVGVEVHRPRPDLLHRGDNTLDLPLDGPRGDGRRAEKARKT